MATKIIYPDKLTGDTITATEFNQIKPAVNDTIDQVAAHVIDTTNPHAVTKSQVGLSNADNTSDSNKPVSTAQQAAISAAANGYRGAFKLTDAAPVSPAIYQNYDLVGTGVLGSSPSGTYTNLLTAPSTPLVIPAPSANHAIINAIAICVDGTYWHGYSQEVAATVDVSGLAPKVVNSKSVVYGPGGQINEDNLTAAFQANILTLGSAVNLISPAYSSGALSKTGAVMGSAPYSTTYRRMSISTSGNMYAYDSTKKYYYSGLIDDVLLAGVVYFNSSLGFVGYECGDVLTYSNFLLTPPTGTAFICLCAKGTTDPAWTFQSKTVTYLTPANTAAIAQMQTDLYSDFFIGAIIAQGGNYTAGALSTSGAALTGAEYTAAYRRTGVGLTSTFIVQTGKIHWYTGVIATQTIAVAGVCYITSAGAFISAECITPGTYNKFRLTVPPNAALIAACTMSTTLNPVIEIGQHLPNGVGNGSVTFEVDTSSSSSTEDGSHANPYKTLLAATNAASLYANSEIMYQGPDIRESVDISKFTRGNIKLTKRQGATTRILGSNKITGWTKTTGQTNVYQTAFAGTITSGSRWEALIFEDGRSSRLIADADRHPLQKGLTYRLPFTEIKPQTSIANVDANAGTYFVTGGIMYINTNDSSNPSTNGFSYEYPVRAANIVGSASTMSTKSYLELNDVTIMYVTDGFAAVGVETLIRRNCTLMASIGQGCWRDDTGKVYSYGDEAAFCDSDGFNGHFANYSGQSSFPQRADNGNCFYWNYWTHDNFDDGFSHHERHQVQGYGGYSEYNGDSGHVSSNDANYVMIGCQAKNNGQRAAITPPENVAGEGFGCRTTVGNTRVKGSVITVDCLSENNLVGFSGNDGGGTPTTGLTAVNCISRNNTLGEYACYKIKNCYGFNANSAIIKVGTIIVENAALVS